MTVQSEVAGGTELAPNFSSDLSSSRELLYEREAFAKRPVKERNAVRPLSRTECIRALRAATTHQNALTAAQPASAVQRNASRASLTQRLEKHRSTHTQPHFEASYV